MTYILNTPYHNDEFKIHFKAMFKILHIKDNERFNSIVLGLNSIKNKKVYEKSLTLRQNMRANLSNENTKHTFIVSLKTLSEPIKSCYSQQLSDETNVQNIQNKICPKDDFKNCTYIQNNFLLKLHILELELIINLHCSYNFEDSIGFFDII